MPPPPLHPLLETGGVADLGSRLKLKLSGPDRLRYLNGQCTNDITALRPGQSIEACVTNAKGKLEGAILVREFQDAFVIDADPALRESLPLRLEKYLIADDCALEDATDDLALFHVLGQGPLHDSFSVETPGTPPRRIEAVASNRFGIPGFDFFLPAEQRDAFRDTLLKHSAGSVLPGRLLEILRIAHGIPAWGAELTPDILPPEAGPAFVERTISYTKGCYIGQEVISRIRSVGKVNKQLVLLVAESPDLPALEPGAELHSGDSPDQVKAGVITSRASGPPLERLIALGYVKTAFTSPGTRLTTASGVPLEVCPAPLA